MLARLIERAGIPTIVVTMMPDVAERLLTPRVVGVEFPYGHPFGVATQRRLQRQVLLTALTVLAGSARPGTRVDVDREWPGPPKEAYRSWQPKEPSPIVKVLLERRS